MTNTTKIVIGAAGALILIVLALGAFGVIPGFQELFTQEEKGDIPANVAESFRDEMIARGVETVGQPIEGFDAFLLLSAFPGLQEEDFDGVSAFEGVYSYENGELKYQRTSDRPISSAEQAVIGYETLLKNVSARLDIDPRSEEAAMEILDMLEEGNTAEIQGTVLAVDLEQVAVDGPALVTLEQATGEVSTVAVPTFGLNLCAASEDIADVYTVETGDTLQVRGYINAAGVIVPCESPDHYLRIQ